ncbi:hypothetical protein AAFC00_006070 [Neodothiora populina]|uniref:Uncharacterized protein n=1 Tax=Neodothiora populina TaxID=2781224 RepID=A0ABR3P6U0_9PEZI
MAGNDAGGYSLPPDLSSILATLAQYAPQQTSTPPPAAPSQPQQADEDDSYSPPPAGIPFAAQQQHNHQPSSFPTATTNLPPSISRDPRLLNRSRVNTPDQTSLSAHPEPYDGCRSSVGGAQQQQEAEKIQQRQFQHDRYQRTHDPRPQPSQRTESNGCGTRSSTAQQQPPAPPQSSSIIDPATITVWSEGLRCVNKIGMQNPNFAAAIRRMITNQQKHEMMWYSGRQELKQIQARRATGASAIQSILGSLSGISSKPTSSTAEPISQEEKQAELSAFDLKVYRAQSAMHDSMLSELKALGVPFFGTYADRILSDDDGNDNDEYNEKVDEGVMGNDKKEWRRETKGQPRHSPRITTRELLGLRKRIIAYLEDMYRE